MAARAETLEKIASLAREGYKYGFFTDIESEQAPLGLNEGTVRFISAKKFARLREARHPAAGTAALSGDRGRRRV